VLLFPILGLGLLSIYLFVLAMLPGDGGAHDRIVLAAEALLASASSVGLALYVARPDDYRADGTSRWVAYDVHGWTVAAVVAGLVVTVCAAMLVARPLKPFLPLLGLGGLVAASLLFVALLGNSLN
jgi:hypothetical protein